MQEKRITLLWRTLSMLLRRADEIPGTPVDMEGADNVTMRIMIGRDDGAPNFAMRHFSVQQGGHTPKHQHDYEHEAVILGGYGTVEVNGTSREVVPGDVLFVEPNALHQFRADKGQSLQFLCFVPISFDCGCVTPGT